MFDIDPTAFGDAPNSTSTLVRSMQNAIAAISITWLPEWQLLLRVVRITPNEISFLPTLDVSSCVTWLPKFNLNLPAGENVFPMSLVLRLFVRSQVVTRIAKANSVTAEHFEVELEVFFFVTFLARNSIPLANWCFPRATRRRRIGMDRNLCSPYIEV